MGLWLHTNGESWVRYSTTIPTHTCSRTHNKLVFKRSFWLYTTPHCRGKKKTSFFFFRPAIVAHFYTGGDVVIFIHVFRVCVWDEPWFLVYSFFFFLALLLRQQPVTSLHFLLLHYQLLPMGRQRNILRKSDAQVFRARATYSLFFSNQNFERVGQ